LAPAPIPAEAAYPKALFWFRRDLRDEDNAGLFHALKSAKSVYCVFVFDREILDALHAREDRRVEFIWESVRELAAALERRGGGLIVLHARATEEIPRLAAGLGVNAVFTNEDYEPAARARDDAVETALKLAGIAMHRAKDQVIFDKDEVLTQAGGTFSVFTPYKNAWLKKLDDYTLKPYPVAKYASRLARPSTAPAMPALEKLGFARTNLRELGVVAGMSGARALVEDFAGRVATYKAARDFPSVKGVSYLSVHNRFGTISIRELARFARDAGNHGAEAWLSELIWRDFYFQILWHHPHASGAAFKREYAKLRWPGSKEHFKAWCEARTGYPIIDAAMLQLNTTGYMHNRLRMIVASFLTKDLLVDWRHGERYFARHLIDFDLAANNGGWQWAASTGCDAQPYFRIFNPVTQSQRFDPKGAFIRRYLPQLAKVPDNFLHEPWMLGPLTQQAAGCVIGRDYPAPIVVHAEQREKALALFASVKAPA
jgi:deoxyribodipyrimidine photo-lyase